MLGLNDPVIVGYMKEGNDYLSWFIGDGLSRVNIIPNVKNISGTLVRNKMYAENDSMLPNEVIDDFKYYENEANLFKNYPFRETLNFNCSDVIVECNEHILLIKRANPPGKGIWALPGGFKNNNETFLGCAIRELFEETGLKLVDYSNYNPMASPTHDNTIEKSVEKIVYSKKIFDSPNRTNGIPRITMAFYFRLKTPDDNLPRLIPSDDALECKWFLIDTILNKMQLYDDHLHIISTIIKKYPIPAHINPNFLF